MSINFPGTIDVFVNPSGTSTLNDPDHSLQHSDANDAIEAIEAVIGTTAGTSVLKDFSAGEFAVRQEGGTVSPGTLTFDSPVINDATLGTPTITGGSFASPTTTGTDAGTATLTNKTLTSPKINEDVALTTTSTELNNLHDKSLGLGAWISWSVTINNLTIGSGTITGAYCKIGKTTLLNVIVAFKNDSSIDGSMSLVLPVANKTGLALVTKIGDVVFYDANVGFIGGGLFSGGAIKILNASSTYGMWVATALNTPMTVVDGDFLTITASYEAN